MAQANSDYTKLARRLPPILGVILAMAILAFVVDISIYVWQFSGGLSADHARWAAFGDFLGGTLGPIFSLLGLGALLLTLHLQSRALSHSVLAMNEQAASLKLQNFESTFFEMVRLHHDIVKALDLRGADHQVTTVGRDCFRVFLDRFRKCHADANAKHNSEGQSVIVTKAYEAFYRRHQDEIGHYFRNFHRILKLVDESQVLNKDSYSGILRAQMSSSELALLFYNALHPVGAKLRPLLERYEMLDNLDVAVLCNPPDEARLLKRSAFGDQDLSAYGFPA